MITLLAGEIGGSTVRLDAIVVYIQDKKAARTRRAGKLSL